MSRWTDETFLPKKYSLILQITQRSESIYAYFTFHRVSSEQVTFHFRILMAGVRQMGLCPCPRCKIPASELYLVGTKQDRKKRQKLARVDDHSRRHHISLAMDAIHLKNFAVDSAYVEQQLKPESLVPTLIFAIDLMHEVEVGVWKAVLSTFSES
ncbi:hypothetical protein Hypma_014643 [Hypsizygus marmoreus]|uniref:Uncharacterized protein n=1 Tax=Hypsizygus marmoreus TaxID=39966 RepID=A0A369JBZ3_HYPMA|nr:hypothetical protein Hypma_014643 [Hypsizygus marmoreus]